MSLPVNCLRTTCPVDKVRSAAGGFIARYYSVLVVLAGWELLSRSGAVSRRLVPNLEQIWAALVHFALSGDLEYHAGITLERAFIGFTAAIVAGVILGTLFARTRWFERLFEPVFLFGYPIPKISLYPVLIFVFGVSDASKIALIFLECLYPITLQTLLGMRSADRALVWAAQNMGATRRQLFWNVLVPSAAPSIFAGIRIALPIAFIVTIITEIIGGSRGLGFVVAFQSSSFEYARALAAIACIGVIGFAFDRALIGLRNRVIFWQKDASAIS